MRTSAQRWLAGALLGGWLATGVAHAEQLTIDQAVARLADQGQQVVFSSDVVDATAVVDLATVTVAELRRALAPLGLDMRRVASYWVVTQATPGDQRPSLRIRSRDALELRDLEVRWRDRRFPLLADEDTAQPVPLAPGTLVTVRADAHRPQLTRLTNGTADVILVPVKLVEKVIVTGSRHRFAGRNVTGSVTSLSADDLAVAPTLGNDALRAAAQLPGMSSVGVSAKPRIRGGLPDELLVRLDGVDLLDSYHLADFQNVFSAIDDRSVEAVDVYTGGFPARYGNRMSGVMEITTNEPEGEGRREIGISLFSLLANAHGAVNDGATSYLVSARRGNLDQILKQVDSSLGRPRYYDAFSRVSHRFSPQGTLSGGAFFTKDDVTLTEDETAARSNVDSRYLWSRLELDHGGGWESATTLTYTWSARSKKLDDLDDDSEAGGLLDHNLDLWKVNARNDATLRRNGYLMEFGAEAEFGRARYDSVAQINSDLIGEIFRGSALRSHAIDTDPDGWSGGVYWAGELPLTPSLLLQPGLRWDFQGYDPDGASYHVSPRLGLRYQPHDLLTLRVDTGRFHQPEALHELQVSDGIADYSRPQSADHLIFGLDWLPSAHWELQAEGYQKRYRRTKQRFENLFNPFVLVPELEPDRVPVDPDRARARGVDVELRHHLSERASASLRYSYMNAQDHIDDTWVPRRWSQRHTVNGSISWRGDNTTLAASFGWHSGWRSAALPESVPEGTRLRPAQVMNRTELKDYVSLDVSVRRTWSIGRSRVTGFASVTNLTNRDNVAGVEYDAELEDGVVSFERQREMLLPLVPSLGVLITF